MRNPSKPCNAKTEEHIDSAIRLDARFCLGCFQDDAPTNASSPTSKLGILRVLPSIIAYMKWDVRLADVSTQLIKSTHSERDIRIAPSVSGRIFR